VILGRFNASTFIPIVVSSVTASFVARILIGNTPAFSVPSYGLNHPLELLLYVLLGVLAALAAVLFVKTLYKIEDCFNMWKWVPSYLKPVFGGMIIGLLGLYYPQILGVGYETIEAAFNSEYSAYTLASVVLVKILATSITLGSGHSGGVFAPSLVIGATLGGSFGLLAQGLVPQIVVHPGAYAIAGMGAVVAGTTQAPITAVLIIFEMTRDYSIMLPLMTAVVFSTLIFSRLSKGSIYTIKLLRRGVNLEDGKDVNLMKQILIKDIMTTPVVTVNDNEQLGNVIEKMHNTKHNSFPVLNSQGELVGIIALQDIREMPVKGIMDVPVKNVMSTRLTTIQPEDSVDQAFRLLRKHDIGHLPVVTAENPRCLVGIITRSDLIKAYERHSLGR
jgi:CIC family chloride channel protein